jgi:2-C-methyl-D-erythritol 4-phosphate cytidylyltransferase
MSQSFVVIIPAAGRSTRYGGQNKLLEPIGGKPVVARAVGAFLGRPDVIAVILAAPVSDFSEIQLALGHAAGDKRVKFCVGGECRAESVRNALKQAPAAAHWVAVHDAARPLVSQTLIDRTFAAAIAHGAAVPALAVALTIKQATGPLPAKVQQTIPRHELWAMQTPQTMRRADLQAAFDTCPLPLPEITDDAQLLELAGNEVWLVMGEERNLKITTPIDRKIAEMYLAEEAKLDAPAKH